MAAISAALVKELRDKTGQSMMDCKKCLVETEGDVEKAIELLRKKGMAVMEKRGGRDTNEGCILSKISDDGKKAIVVSLCCETDFTSKNDNFKAVVQCLADGLFNADTIPADIEALGTLPSVDGRPITEAINDIISLTGEKTTLGQFARYELDGPGLLYCYVHFNGKVATLLQIDAENDQAASSEAIKTLASDLAMHITAVNPEALSRDDVDPELIAKEREIAMEQVKGKPENIIDKIVNGKIDKWLKQIALLEQPFVKDDKKTITELVEEVGKEAGGKLAIKRFIRMQIG